MSEVLTDPNTVCDPSGANSIGRNSQELNIPSNGIAHPFKQAFRALASGIVVITFDAGTAVHGFTATSLTSVSMDPPLALFCVANQSRSRLHLEPGRKVGFSFLGEDQAEQARFFASNRPFGECGQIKIDRVAGAPVVAGSMAVISAAVETLVPAGDHIICVCALHEANSAADKAPLLYHSGRYNGLARIA
jgi:flavin reductase (DIM6/NTAB) family NADH-FMN oxidoreductase RutF